MTLSWASSFSARAIVSELAAFVFRAHGKSAAQIRRDVLDVVAAAEIYAEKGHDDVAVAVTIRARPFPFPEGRIDQFGRADALENIHDVKNPPKEVMFSDFIANFVRMSIFFMLEVS